MWRDESGNEAFARFSGFQTRPRALDKDFWNATYSRGLRLLCGAEEIVGSRWWYAQKSDNCRRGGLLGGLAVLWEVEGDFLRASHYNENRKTF